MKMRGARSSNLIWVLRHFPAVWRRAAFLCHPAVILASLGLWSQLENPIQPGPCAHVGVDFFFVLSGYLITTLLLREETRDGSYSLRGFYWRRILRIVPIYFFVVTVAAIWSIGIKGRNRIPVDPAGLLPVPVQFPGGEGHPLPVADLVAGGGRAILTWSGRCC